MNHLTVSEADLIADAVLGHRLDIVPVPLLVRSDLAPRAFLCGVRGAGREELIASFAHMALRHRTVRSELTALLLAWQEAGIRVLVFKGFHLAEWVFDDPALRPYNDVDVLMDPTDVIPASTLALAAGWRMPWSRKRSATPHKHEEMQLVSPSGITHLDVHRFVIHSASRMDRVQRRVTAAAWQGSHEAHLDRARVRVLRPEDAVLIGLVLNRFWSPDDLTVKPLDYFDLRAISSEHGVGPDDLARRARELGCARTWRLFRSRCDPWGGRLTLRRPSLAERQWFFAQISLERPHPYLEDVVVRAGSTVGAWRTRRRRS